MDEFLANLRASRDAHPRTIWLIYNYPAEHESIVRSEIFSTHETVHYGGSTIRVYCTQ